MSFIRLTHSTWCLSPLLFLASLDQSGSGYATSSNTGTSSCPSRGLDTGWFAAVQCDRLCRLSLAWPQGWQGRQGEGCRRDVAPVADFPDAELLAYVAYLPPVSTPPHVSHTRSRFTKAVTFWSRVEQRPGGGCRETSLVFGSLLPVRCLLWFR